MADLLIYDPWHGVREVRDEREARARAAEAAWRSEDMEEWEVGILSLTPPRAPSYDAHPSNMEDAQWKILEKHWRRSGGTPRRQKIGRRRRRD